MGLDEKGKFNNAATAAAWAISSEIVVGYAGVFVNIVVMHNVVDTVIATVVLNYRHGCGNDALDCCCCYSLS